MLIKAPSLVQWLNKSFHAVYIIIGNDPYLFNEAVGQIKQSYQRQCPYTQTILDINTATDWEQLAAEANSYSLFSDQILLDARYEKKTIDAAGKSFFQQYLNNINDRCLILLRAPAVSTKSIASLVDHPAVAVVQVVPLSAKAMAHWIEEKLKSIQLILEPQLIPLIQHYTQGNMLACAQLIDKLSLCYPPGERLTAELLKEQLSDHAHFELYELADACLDPKPLKALRLLQQSRQERVEPTLILWILTQAIRQLLQLKQLASQGMTVAHACKQLNIWSSKIALYNQASSRFNGPELQQLLQYCSTIDESIKTSQSLLVWHEFDRIILSMATGCQLIQ